jgi:hypothetical protein
MSEPTLTDIINETLNELDSEVTDTPDESQEDAAVEAVDEVEADEAETADETEAEESDESEDEEVEEGEDTDEDVEAETDTFVVKVDGEELSVTLDELKAGYSRQAHFTRSMQALKEEREAFETEAAQHVDTIQQIADLDAAWEANPVSVLTSLLASTENPSYALGLLVKEAAANDLLTEDALQYFGIDAATKQAWSTETELERLRREVRERTEREAQLQAKEQESASEARVREAVQVFESQINEIVAEEGLDFPTVQERAAFKADLLRYAKDNSILDLKKAYAALAYERDRESRATAARRAKSHQKKAATKVVSRSGASAAGVSPVANQSQDLRSVIEQTMKDLKF